MDFNPIPLRDIKSEVEDPPDRQIVRIILRPTKISENKPSSVTDADFDPEHLDATKVARQFKKVTRAFDDGIDIDEDWKSELDSCHERDSSSEDDPAPMDEEKASDIYAETGNKPSSLTDKDFDLEHLEASKSKKVTRTSDDDIDTVEDWKPELDSSQEDDSSDEDDPAPMDVEKASDIHTENASKDRDSITGNKASSLTDADFDTKHLDATKNESQLKKVKRASDEGIDIHEDWKQELNSSLEGDSSDKDTPAPMDEKKDAENPSDIPTNKALKDSDTKADDVKKANSEPIDGFKLPRLPSKSFEANRTFQCHDCGEKITGRRDFVIHRTDHLYAYKCNACERYFKKNDAYERHSHSKHPGLQCKDCKKNFATKGKLYSHVCKSQDRKKLNSCKTCGKHLFCQKKLVRHIKEKHPNEKCEPCGFCNELFESQEAMKRHEDSEHSEEKSKVKSLCSICGKEFQSSERLKAHQNNMHGKVKEVIQCESCPRSFSSMKGWNDHLAKTHQGKKQFPCPHCKTDCPTEDRLKTHIIVYHGRSKRVKCFKCDLELSAKSLMLHMAYQHEDKEPNICQYCDKEFLTKQSLQRHIRTVHEMERKYACEKCGKKYGHKHELIRHSKAKLGCHGIKIPK